MRVLAGQLRFRFGTVVLVALLSVLMLAASPSGPAPVAAEPSTSTVTTTSAAGPEMRSTIQPAALAAGDSVSQPGGESGRRSISPEISQSVPQSISQPFSDPVSQPISLSFSLPSAGSSARAVGRLPSPPASLPYAISARTLVRNGTFDDGMNGWVRSHLASATTTSIADVSGDRRLELTASQSQGAVAQDVPVAVEAGRTYRASVRAESSSGFPVLVQLAIHALDVDGTIGETSSRFVVVEGHEVPITTSLRPRSDHRSLRIEMYLHTVDRPVLFDDATLVVDAGHEGPDNFGYQQPRVRYLDHPVSGPVDPARLQPGRQYRVAVSVDTTTDQRWHCCGADGPVRLGTEDEDLVGGSARTSTLFVPPEVEGSSWISANRIRFDRDESTFGGSFTTLITAPAEPGPFAERFRLVAEGEVWIPGPVIEIIGSVVAPEAGQPDLVTGGSDDEQRGERSGDLLVDCPPGLSIALPDPAGSDCATEIDGFDLRSSVIDPGAFTMQWLKPAEVAADFYRIEVQDLALSFEPERSAKAQTLRTGRRKLTVAVAPGRYSVRVSALDGQGRWVRSEAVTVEVTDPAPLFEADVPSFGCRSESGISVPWLCPPGAPQPDDDSNTPSDDGSACATVSVSFERNMLTRYRGPDRSEIVPVELRCSLYEVRLRSSDAQHAIGYQGDQTGERWFLIGLNAAGQVIYTSDPTPDLSDHQTEAVFSMGVVDVVGLVAVRAQHVGGGDSPNSITVDATFVPVS